MEYFFKPGKLYLTKHESTNLHFWELDNNNPYDYFYLKEKQILLFFEKQIENGMPSYIFLFHKEFIKMSMPLGWINNNKILKEFFVEIN